MVLLLGHVIAAITIKILDHLITGDNKYYIFTKEGLIESYEEVFLTSQVKAVPETKKPNENPLNQKIFHPSLGHKR